MKTITDKFKEEITKLGREIDFKFFLHTNDKIITEDSKFLMTQDNRHLVVEQFDDEEVDETITGEDIYNVSIVNQGSLLSTLMKELDFEVRQDLRIGDVIGCQFGLKVDGDYEYIDYGKYMVYSKEFNEDTKTYSYVAFDRMLLTMQEASKEFLTDLEGDTLAFAIHKICEEVGLSYTATQEELTEYPNLSKNINEGTFTDMQITYRDILDMICQALGLSMIVDGSQIKLKTPTQAESKTYETETIVIEKDEGNIINGFMSDGGALNANNNWRTLYVECEPNKTYNITKIRSAIFRVGDFTNIPAIGSSWNNRIKDETATSITYTTSANGNYLAITYFNSTGSLTEQEIYDSIKIETDVVVEITVSGDIDEKYIKDTNVSFGKKYMINSVVLSRSEDSDNIYRRDEESIAENGVHEFKIKDNLIMLYDDREDYIDEIFEQLNGLEYYINDYSSTGITYLDWLDFYNVTIGDKTYKCLMLNDEININQGLEENIHTEEPEETVTDYKTSSKTDKEVSFIVDKQNGSIKAKVSKGEVINEINLDETGAEINADKISLAGKEIKLTADDITIKSTNFNVDKDGNITANNVTLNSGTFKGDINTSSNIIVGNDLYVGQNQSSSNVNHKTIYFSNTMEIARHIQQGVERLWMQAPNFDLTYNDGTHYYGILESSLYDTNISNGNQYIQLDNGTIRMSSQPVIGSDEKLKQEIKDIDTSWIDELKVKEFEYKKNPNNKQIGLIAQDYLDKEYGKYFLNQDKDGYYAITYGNITNALIQYCQEMKKEINSLKEEIKQLKESDK